MQDEKETIKGQNKVSDISEGCPLLEQAKRASEAELKVLGIDTEFQKREYRRGVFQAVRAYVSGKN